MLSQEAELALERLAEGAVMNPIHTIARELIDAGLAMNDWGRLALTEEGRRWTRRNASHFRKLTIVSEHVADLSQYHSGYAIDNPMGLGPELPANAGTQREDIPFAPAPYGAAGSEIAHEEIDQETSVPAITDYTRGLRAAGVATGVTGIEVDVKWVHAFMDAFNENR